MSLKKSIIFFSLLLALNLFSQIVLQGTVTNNGGEYLGSGAEPVPGALVTVTDHADTARTFSDSTNEQGQYSIEIDQTSVDNNPSRNNRTFRLYQNYPNPFNPSTVIGYELACPSHVTVDIYNVLGQKIRTLIDGFYNSSGQVMWDATNDMGQGVSAGLYIYSIQAEGKRINRKMLLLDGHQGNEGTIMNSSQGSEKIENPILYKPVSDQYLLKVTGENFVPYEQSNLEISASMTVDVTVNQTVTDIDDNVYQTVKIGDQWWTSENLKVTHYDNGDPITNVTDITEWKNLSTGAFCVYNYNEVNADTYGYLYNWYTIDDSRSLAPAGWHVAEEGEWRTLVDYLGGSDVAGGKLKEAGLDHWKDPNTGATNESGFSALPGGTCSYNRDEDYFSGMGDIAFFWTSSQVEADTAWSRPLIYNITEISQGTNNMKNGFSVRLLKD